MAVELVSGLGDLILLAAMGAGAAGLAGAAGAAKSIMGSGERPNPRKWIATVAVGALAGAGGYVAGLDPATGPLMALALGYAGGVLEDGIKAVRRWQASRVDSAP